MKTPKTKFKITKTQQILLLFIVLFFNALNGQNFTIDSLKNVIICSKNDSSKCSALLNIIELEADNFAEEYNNQLQTICLKGVKGQPRSKFFLNGLISSYINCGYFAFSKGSISKAIDDYNKALILAQKNNLKDHEGFAYNYLAQCYLSLGNIEKCIDIFHKALKIAEKTSKTELISLTLMDLGTVYCKQKDYDKALEYYNRSLKFAKKNNDYESLAILYNNIALIFSTKKDYVKSHEYYRMVLLMNKENSYDAGIVTAQYNIGSLFQKQHNFDSALFYYELVLKNIDKNAHIETKLNLFNDLSLLYVKKGNIDKALNFGIQGYSIAKSIGAPEFIGFTSKTLKEIYLKKNSFEKALKFFEIEIKMRDSLNNQTNRKAIIKSQLKYEYEKKAAADSIFVAKEKKLNEIKFEQEKTKRNYLIAGFIFVSIFSLFAFNKLRVISKQKKLIEFQKNKVEKQKEVIDEKQKEIIQSINYAKRIQESLLPNNHFLNKKLLGK